jgi:hypothetical protein
MRKTFSTAGKPPPPPSPPSFLASSLRDGAAIVLLEHVALLESVVDRSLVVGTRLL